MDNPDSVAINTAAGMVMARFFLTADEAITRTQAHAFSHNRLLADVTADVATRRLTTDHLPP